MICITCKWCKRCKVDGETESICKNKVSYNYEEPIFEDEGCIDWEPKE